MSSFHASDAFWPVDDLAHGVHLFPSPITPIPVSGIYSRSLAINTSVRIRDLSYDLRRLCDVTIDGFHLPIASGISLIVSGMICLVRNITLCV